MSFLSSLEKFGLGDMSEMDITESAETDKKEEEAVAEPVRQEPQETDFLIAKRFKCPVCDAKVSALTVRGTKLKRIEPDLDLRPRHMYIDALKYNTVFCTNCGYAAMTDSFSPLSAFQIKRLKEQVQAKFTCKPQEDKATYTYEEAVDRYQMCLLSAMVKNVKLSEKSYLCLKIAWLYRELMVPKPEDTKEEAISKWKMKEQYDGFYRQAYEGFLKAISQEAPPFCGMKTATVEYLLANMAVYFEDIPVANRYLSSLLFSKTVSTKMKSHCAQLKEKLIALKKAKGIVDDD